MAKKSNILKIVKEDILRILGEEKRRTSLEILKEEIKVSLSFINEAIEELKREGYHYSKISVDKLLRINFMKNNRILTRIKEEKIWKYVIRK